MLTPSDMRPYQWRTIRFAMQTLCCGLFLDMGLGKTISALTVIRKLLVRRQVKRVLVIAPLRVVHSVWQQEAKKWTHTKSLTFSIVTGNAKQRMKALDEPAHIYLTNPENVRWLVDHYIRIKWWPFDMLIIDESDKFKDQGTHRFRAIRKPLAHMKRRMILTGTPTPQSLLDLWSQVYLLDMGDRLGTAYGRYKERWFRQGYDGYSYEPTEEAEGQINERIRDIVLRLDRNDWLDLPGVMAPNDVVLDFDGPTRAMYREMEREMFIKIDELEVEAVIAATVTQKCQQIANGAIYGTDENTRAKDWREIHTLKLDAAEDVVAQTGSPVAIAYYFKHDLERLKTRFPKAPVIGSGNAKDTTRIIDEWKAGKHRVMLIHPASVSHGLDGLQYGGHVILMFSMMWSNGTYQQLIARFDRNGQTKPVQIHRLVVKNTVDELACMSLERKGNAQKAFLEALREYREKTLENAEAF